MKLGACLDSKVDMTGGDLVSIPTVRNVLSMDRGTGPIHREGGRGEAETWEVREEHRRGRRRRRGGANLFRSETMILEKQRQLVRIGGKTKQGHNCFSLFYFIIISNTYLIL